MKRNKFFMLGIVTVLVAVLSLTFVSNTFAKYTSTVTGQDTARVAKWEWVFAGDVQATQSNTTKIDVFNTAVYDFDPVKNEVVVGSNDEEVKDDSTKPIIAPGTGGKAEFKITNNSEVSATYEVILSADEKSVPLQWSIDNETWHDDISSLNASLKGELAYDATSPATITLYWHWGFDGDDTDDTALGTAATLAEPSITITVNVIQKD